MKRQASLIGCLNEKAGLSLAAFMKRPILPQFGGEERQRRLLIYASANVIKWGFFFFNPNYRPFFSEVSIEGVAHSRITIPYFMGDLAY